jgi:hypothetical protein
MIFIWSSDGGPLQYIGLALFLLQIGSSLLGQVFLNNYYPDEEEDNNSNSNSRSPQSTTDGEYPSLLPSILILLVAVGILGVVVWNQFQQLRTFWREQIIARGNHRNYGLPLVFAAGTVAGVVTYYLLANYPTMLYSILQLFPIFYFFYYQIPQLRNDNDDENHNNSQRRRPPAGANELADIVTIVSKLPVEEYISNDALDKCTISQLQTMLEIRKGPDAGNFVERRELQAAVAACRTNESCCICFEDYQEGDPLRVLPKCHHDFHLECIDQWAYTFATSRERSTKEPSCPLCKTAIGKS